MRCVNPRPVELRRLKAKLVVVEAAHEGAYEEDLRELTARVEAVGADIGVDFRDGGEGGGGKGRSVKVGGLED